MLVRVFLSVRGKEVGPFGFELFPPRANGCVGIIRLLGDVELGFGVETELGFEGGDIISLEGCCGLVIGLAWSTNALTSTMDTVCALQLRAKTNGGAKTDDSGLRVLFARFGNRFVNALQVAME